MQARHQPKIRQVVAGFYVGMRIQVRHVLVDERHEIVRIKVVVGAIASVGIIDWILRHSDENLANFTAIDRIIKIDTLLLGSHNYAVAFFGFLISLRPLSLDILFLCFITYGHELV